MNRKSQRVFLSTPLKGHLGATPVAVVDLGPAGAGLEHEGAIRMGDRLSLTIHWRHPIRVTAVVRHSLLQQLASARSNATYHTGVEFDSASEDQTTLIEGVLIDEAREKIAEWEANMTGTRRQRLPSLTPIPRKPHAFVWHHFVRGAWTTTTTRDPNQPIDGFAVCDDESDEKVQLLRQAYEWYDEDDRYMLRMMAQLAITERTLK